jgi:hypothetical protein
VCHGWLPMLNCPDGALLLAHLSRRHPVELKPLLQRMETECIDTVVMEAFEQVRSDDREVQM